MWSPPWNWSAFNAELVAGLVALAVGIPVGLRISYAFEARQRQDELSGRRARRAAILRALKIEIEHNIELMSQLDDMWSRNQRSTAFYPLDMDIWPAISDEVINSTTSVNFITEVSRLYFELRHLQRKLDVHFSLGLTPTEVRTEEGKTASEQMHAIVVGAITVHIPEIQPHAKRVLELIEDELRVLTAEPESEPGYILRMIRIIRSLRRPSTNPDPPAPPIS